MSTQIGKSLIALFFLAMIVTGCNTNTKQTADNKMVPAGRTTKKEPHSNLRRGSLYNF